MVQRPKNEIELLNLLKNKRIYNTSEYLRPCDDFNTIGLIDGDGLVYKVETTTSSIYEAFVSLHNRIDSMLREARCTHFIMFHTTKKNFRHALTDDYKATRKKLPPRSPFFFEIREMLLTMYSSTSYKGYEADDLVAMAHRKLGVYNSVLISNDKDLLHVYPGLIYNPDKRIFHNVNDPIGKLKLTIRESVNKHGKTIKHNKVTGHGTKFLYLQSLWGDTIDNVVGVPGIGVKGGYELLKDATTLMEMHNICKDAYLEYYVKKNNFTEEHAMKQFIKNMGLLYMQQRDVTFKIPRPRTMEEIYKYANVKELF
jgi:5'-3' exonuclease